MLDSLKQKQEEKKREQQKLAEEAAQRRQEEQKLLEEIAYAQAELNELKKGRVLSAEIRKYFTDEDA